jgi:phosphoserine phosphatase
MSRPVAVVTSTIPITVGAFDRELIRQVQAKGYDVCVVSSPGLANRWAYASVRSR